MKEEIKGKVLRKPDVVEHGHQLRSGELKRQEEENVSACFEMYDVNSEQFRRIPTHSRRPRQIIQKRHQPRTLIIPSPRLHILVLTVS